MPGQLNPGQHHSLKPSSYGTQCKGWSQPKEQPEKLEKMKRSRTVGQPQGLKIPQKRSPKHGKGGGQLFANNLVQFLLCLWGFPGGTEVKNLHANARNTRDMDSIPGSGRFPGEGNGNPLQYSCLVNSMDRGAWWAIVHKVAKSQTQLSTHATYYVCAQKSLPP